MSIFEGKPLKELDIHFNDAGEPESMDLITSAGVLTISDPIEIDEILHQIRYAVSYDIIRTNKLQLWTTIGEYLTWFITKVMEW